MNLSFPQTEYFAFLAEGKFMIQRSPATGRHVFYPRIAEPLTGSPLEWVEASGRGTVYSVTVLHPKPPEPAYNVVLIDLEEGPRMMSRVDGIAPGAVKIGMRVRARIIQENGAALLVFEPSGDLAGAH
ncbi:MAG: Zn-ribbon domain-containing OB-fold protein [Pseudomonadota bacterium]